MASAVAASPTSKSEPQTIDLHTVPTPQLSQLKSQITTDIQTLTTSYTSLRAAQAKFRDCIATIKSGVENPAEGTQVLVPLTPSLYVPGRLTETGAEGRVVVDVGTGFFVEKAPAQARQFYTDKIAELGKNLQDLEGIVQGKQGTLKVVEDVLRQKVLQEQSQPEGVAKSES